MDRIRPQPPRNILQEILSDRYRPSPTRLKKLISGVRSFLATSDDSVVSIMGKAFEKQLLEPDTFNHKFFVIESEPPTAKALEVVNRAIEILCDEEFVRPEDGIDIYMHCILMARVDVNYNLKLGVEAMEKTFSLYREYFKEILEMKSIDREYYLSLIHI